MAHLGILSLDTAFPRIVGDAGNPGSYPFDAKIAVVKHAEAARVVSDQPLPEDMVDAFVRTAQELEAGGASALVSTCGFLVHAQDRVAQAVRVPVMLSPLSMYPLVQSICPGRVGVLTASEHALGARTLKAVGIKAADVGGMEHHAAFRDTFLAPKSHQPNAFSYKLIAQLVLQEAQSIAAQAPLSALILECGNLPPYAPILREELGVPVFTILDAATWLMSA
ncbi:MAG: aspartate/glutamate racemase family protein [Pseudomonadota bacterium]